jgi:hypothetical protein
MLAPEVAFAEVRDWWEGRSSAGVDFEGCRVAGSSCWLPLDHIPPVQIFQGLHWLPDCLSSTIPTPDSAVFDAYHSSQRLRSLKDYLPGDASPPRLTLATQ